MLLPVNLGTAVCEIMIITLKDGANGLRKFSLCLLTEISIVNI